MVSDLGHPSYQGYLNDNCETIAEVLGGPQSRSTTLPKRRLSPAYSVWIEPPP